MHYILFFFQRISLQHTERVLNSLLYAVHLSLSYILMLIAMTFNVYLFLAIIFGIGTGHLLYTWSRIAPSTSKNQRGT
jgi:copper transporter 1